MHQHIVYFLRWFFPVLWVLFTTRLIGIIQAGDASGFYQQFRIIAAITLVYFILRFITVKRWWVKWFWLYQKELRNTYLEKILYIENNHYDQIGTGNLIAIVEKWIQARSRFLVDSIKSFWNIVIIMVLNLYFLFVLNPLYPLGFLILIIGVSWLGIVTNKRMNKHRRQRVESAREGTRKIVRLFMTKFDILQNNKVTLELDQIAKTSDGCVDANNKMAYPSEIFFLWPQGIVFIIIIFIFYYWGIAIFEWSMSLAFFYGIVSSMFLLQWAFDRTLGAIKDMSKEWADIEKLWTLVDNTPTIKGINKWKALMLQQGNIRFDEVVYQYTGGKEIFQGMSLEIQGWKKTALVGMSGAGKTTMLKLIAGYVQPTWWVVYIDEQPLPAKADDKKSISLKSYYKHVWYLTQEPNVFDGSVYDNLVYALDYKPTKEVLHKVLEESQCQFIYDFKDGLQTEIGEKGIRLSGGQRQRLAIAKIFLKNPEIVLLDEPTSALDSLSEEAITKAMHNLFKWRTVIIIAHRLQTVKQADDIIVLENGKIIERWTHENLVAMGGHYAKMLELQSWF